MTSVSYHVRDGEPVVVEALKVRALPEGGSKHSRYGVPRVALNTPKPVRPRAGCGGTEMRR
jgi:hypothetical protein